MKKILKYSFITILAFLISMTVQAATKECTYKLSYNSGGANLSDEITFYLDPGKGIQDKFKIKSTNKEIKVLNLFAYTGGATVACLSAGASVCHVDSSKGMVSWAKENVISSGLQDRKVRYIVDDVVKFVNREIRRGNKYDAIIMDPPSYGRGPKGETWKIEEAVFPLINICADILKSEPLFFLINSYTTGLQPAVLSYMLNTVLVERFGGKVEADEIGLPVSSNGLILPCGASGRYTKA